MGIVSDVDFIGGSTSTASTAMRLGGAIEWVATIITGSWDGRLGEIVREGTVGAV